MTMILNPYVFSAPPFATQTLWSPTNKASDVVLTNGGKDVYSTSGAATGGVVLSDSGKSSGKFYAEFSIQSSGSTSQAMGVGVHNGTSNLTLYLGQAAAAWGAWVEGAAGGSRRTYNNNTGANLVSRALSLGQIARVAVDITAGKLWLAHFGSSSWLGGGEPAAGTSPTYTFTPSGTYFLAANPRSGNVSATGNVIRLISPSDWVNLPPAGFGVWTE